MKTARFLFPILLLHCFFVASDCHHATAPPPGRPDTTSHNFTWTTYEFGEGSLSALKDAAVVNDTLAYAVGEVYLKDSTGQVDPTRYNAVVWNGTKWTIIRIPYNDQGWPYYNPIESVFAFGANNIWFCGNGVLRWTGTQFIEMPVPTSVWGQDQMNAVCGTSGEAIFIAGTNGSIVRYDGTTWLKLGSSTTINLRDLWGSPGSQTVLTSGYTSDLSQSCILKYDGASWTTLWSTSSALTPPYGQLAMSIWASTENLYVAADGGIYRTALAGGATQRVLSLPAVPFRIRGSAENNIAVVCGDGSIWHYNGASWMQVRQPDLLKPLYSVAVSTNMIVAVGFDATTMNTQGLVCMGRRRI